MNLYDYKWDVFRSRNQFESGLYNYFFAYKFSQLPNVKIRSHLGSLNKHKSLIKKIEKVLFSWINEFFSVEIVKKTYKLN